MHVALQIQHICLGELLRPVHGEASFQCASVFVLHSTVRGSWRLRGPLQVSARTPGPAARAQAMAAAASTASGRRPCWRTARWRPATRAAAWRSGTRRSARAWPPSRGTRPTCWRWPRRRTAPRCSPPAWTRRRARATPCALPSFSGPRTGVRCGRQPYGLAVTAQAGSVAAARAPALALAPALARGLAQAAVPSSGAGPTARTRQTSTGLLAARVGS